ncbi:MAG: hypothetical protein Q9190_006662 [Brigantiaea leucoxantha]
MLTRVLPRVVAATTTKTSTSLLASTTTTSPSTARITATRTAHAPRRLYHEKVLDHYTSPRNVGSFPKSSPHVGTGLVGAPACGDVMKLQIRVDPSSNTIEEVKFKTFGCGSAIASSSYLTELVQGMTLEEAGGVRNTEIARELCLPPVKLHCSMLAEDAIKSAVKDYYAKNPEARRSDLGGTGRVVPKVEIEREVMGTTETGTGAGAAGVAATV